MVILKETKQIVIFHRSKIENYGQLFVSRQLHFGRNVGSAIGDRIYCFINEEDEKFNGFAYGNFITYFKADFSRILDTLNLEKSIKYLGLDLNINITKNSKYTDYLAWECYEYLKNNKELPKISGIRYTRQTDGDCVIFYNPYKDLKLVNYSADKRQD
jgi:hypothetical protein